MEEDGHQVSSPIFPDTYSSTSKCHLHHLPLSRSRCALPFIFHSFSFLIFRSFFSLVFCSFQGTLLIHFYAQWDDSGLFFFFFFAFSSSYPHLLPCIVLQAVRMKKEKGFEATSFLLLLPPTSFLLLVVVISSFSFKAGRQFIADLRYYWLMSRGKEEERGKWDVEGKGESEKKKKRVVKELDDDNHASISLPTPFSLSLL